MAAAARAGIPRHPNGTPLPSVVSRLRASSSFSPLLSIVSYNVLAPVYVRPIDKRTGKIQPFAAFENVADDKSHEVLSIEKRGPKLLDILTKCGADAICLQELQLERGSHDDSDGDEEGHADYVLPQWIHPLVEQGGGAYATFLPGQEELRQIAKRNVKVLDVDAAVTCAILYRADRLVPAGLSNDDNPEEKNPRRDEDTNTSLSLCLRGAPGTDLETLDPLVLTSLHLDATDEVKRVGQIARVFRRARTLARIKMHEGLPPLIIAGDMNIEFVQGSCVGAYLQINDEDEAVPSEGDFRRACAVALFLPPGTEPTEKQMEEWQKLYLNAKNTAYDHCIRISRVGTGPTHAGLDREVKSSSEKQVASMSTWSLDHILHTSERFRPVAMWSTLEDDLETAQRTGLPNKKFPSDHIPLGVVLASLPPPVLSNSATDKLVAWMTQLWKCQSEYYEQLQSDLDLQLSSIKARYPDVHLSPSSKQKKHQKPPQEVMDFMRQRRIRFKEVNSVQQKERQDLVDRLSDMERLALQNYFECTAREWVERGQKQ